MNAGETIFHGMVKSADRETDVVAAMSTTIRSCDGESYSTGLEPALGCKPVENDITSQDQIVIDTGATPIDDTRREEPSLSFTDVVTKDGIPSISGSSRDNDEFSDENFDEIFYIIDNIHDLEELLPPLPDHLPDIEVVSGIERREASVSLASPANHCASNSTHRRFAAQPSQMVEDIEHLVHSKFDMLVQVYIHGNPGDNNRNLAALSDQILSYLNNLSILSSSGISILPCTLKPLYLKCFSKTTFPTRDVEETKKKKKKRGSYYCGTCKKLKVFECRCPRKTSVRRYTGVQDPPTECIKLH